MPLDFSGYVPGIPNMGPRYVAPTTLQLIEGLQIQIKALKTLLGTFSDAEYEQFKTDTENALEGLQNALTLLSGTVSLKEDKSNKTATIDSSSTDTQYPTAKAVYDMLTTINGTLSDLALELADKADGNTLKAAKIAAAIPYGECDNTSTATDFTATVPGITELKNGTAVLLKNGVITSATGFTININGLGAKPSYSNMTTGNDVTPTAPTRDTTIFNINYTMLIVYSEDIVTGGGWIMYRGYDANTNTIGYQIRTNSQRLKMTDKMYRYRLMFTGVAPDTLVPANNSTSTNATSARTPITTPINPFGPIYYYGYTSNIEAGARPNASYYWQQYVVTLGYSFTASTLTEFRSLYLKCTPQADGSAIIDPTTPYTQNLPTTNDGKIYIFLGVATSSTAFELNLLHPVYYHDGTALRLWTGPVT